MAVFAGDAPEPARKSARTSARTSQRLAGGSTQEAEFPTLVVGDRVKAVFKARAGLTSRYAGQITSANDDGTFDILYDDADKEAGVERRYITKMNDKVLDPTPPKK